MNNFAFGPEVDHQLKERFANMKEGTYTRCSLGPGESRWVAVIVSVNLYDVVVVVVVMYATA